MKDPFQRPDFMVYPGIVMVDYAGPDAFYQKLQDDDFGFKREALKELHKKGLRLFYK